MAWGSPMTIVHDPAKAEDHAPRVTGSRPRQPDLDATTGEPDLVRAYLDEIGRVALLNAEQEVELAKRIEAGLFAAKLLAADSTCHRTQGRRGTHLLRSSPRWSRTATAHGGTCSRPTCGWWSPRRGGTRAAACRCST